jgi:putative copper export protein
MQKDTTSNPTENKFTANRYNDWHYFVMAIIEGLVIIINFIGMLFMSLQIQSSLVWIQILTGAFILIQVPLFLFVLGFAIYSIAFLFVNKNNTKNARKSIRVLIRIHVIYVLYFMTMFIYWGITTMSLPQPQ